MKTQMFRLIPVLILTVLLGAVSAQAQNSSQLKADIPFDFTVGQKTFRAGSYEISVTNRLTDHPVLIIRSATGGTSHLIATRPGLQREVQEEAKLVFNRYGDYFFLSQIWMPASSDSLDVSKSRLERALERETLAAMPRSSVAKKRETVAISLIARR